MPKTSSSNRTIPIPRFVVDTLLRRSVAMPPDNPTDAIFYSQTGTFIQASSIRRSLRSALAAAGMDPEEVKVTPHAFRRTVATMLAREPDVGAAASLLGHGSVLVAHASYVERLAEVEDYRYVLDRLGATKVSK